MCFYSKSYFTNFDDIKFEAYKKEDSRKHVITLCLRKMALQPQKIQ